MRKPLLALVLVAVAACGGAPKKPSLSADDVVKPTEGTKEDMPAAPSKEATDTAAPAKTGPAADAPAGGAIVVAPLKIVPAKKTAKGIELKQDGSIVSDGKTIATIKGDQVNDPSGSTLVTVGVDGSLVGANVKPGWKFSGDELVGEDGAKMTVGDDGTLTATKKDGKTENLGKVEGGANAKRAVLISSLLWISTATPATTAPAAKTAPKAVAKPKK